MRRGSRRWLGRGGLALSLLLVSASTAGGVSLTVVAQRGVGDGHPAVEAPVGAVADLALDAAGNLYLAVPQQGRVRRVRATDGVITTVAGNGVWGFAGDGGPAASASVFYPVAIAVDRGGTLYVCDQENHRIRAVDASGTIRTIAGTGAPGFGGDGGAAVAAQLSAPSGIAVDDSGTLYVSDAGNCRIRKIAPDGTITTVAGTGEVASSGDRGPAVEAALRVPGPLTIDGSGTLYAIESRGGRVRRIDANGIITTVEGFDAVDGVEADSAGRVYVSERGQVWCLGCSGGRIAATTVHPDDRRFRLPRALTVGPSGDLFIADVGESLVKRMDVAGKVSIVAGNRTAGRFGDGGPANGASFGCADVVRGRQGELYVSDPMNHRIAVISPAGTISTFAGTGTTAFSGDQGPASEAALYAPTGLAMSNDGTLYVADSANHRVRQITPDNIISTVAGTGEQGFGGDGGSAVAAALSLPTALAMGQDGGLLISDVGNLRVRRVAPEGTITTLAGSGSSGIPVDGAIATASPLDPPAGIAVHGDGTVLVAVPSRHAVYEIRPDGRIYALGDGGSAPSNGSVGRLLLSPSAVAVDTTGRVLVGTSSSAHLLEFDRQTDTYLTWPANVTPPETPLGHIVWLSSAGGAGLYACDNTGGRILHIQP